ncbi:Xaa-Pro aminopeptidase [Pseudoalteromonas mariniglutinosa]|uniref:Xaa-Pro aminopeptidase n=1 Tax=Pseudoalteromonas mariniglutinosa TaxID=206042 RepID=UPI00384BF6CF
MLSIAKSEFKARRERLLAMMGDNSIAIIPAANEVTRSRDTEYAFRQDSDFYYLTGFNEPDAILVLCSSSVTPSTLICRDKDKQAEIWHGRRIGFEKAKTDYLFDATYALSELDDTLLTLLNTQQTLFYAQGTYPAFDSKVWGLLNTLRCAPKSGYQAPHTIKDIRALLHEMRLFKSDAEINIMRQACEVSAQGHIRAMQFAKLGATEYQLEAELHHHYAINGARFPAYSSIVGSGDNANILHYTQNDAELADGDLVLIDSGCELQGYAADITRTFPVNGTFSEPQAALYSIVLAAQHAAFNEVKPGGSFSKANAAASKVLTQGLLELGLLQGELEQLIASQAYKVFYMHGIGHWLGLDVHDVGDYKCGEKERCFEPRMVLTIEPGLYINHDANVPKQFRGIGIRIEDNLVVTKHGHENLTVGVPKAINDIEALMRASKS